MPVAYCLCMQDGIVAPFRGSLTGLSETEAFPDVPMERIRSLAASLLGTIEVARTLAKSGRKLDLTGLDTHVGLLCAKALDLSPDEGRAFREQLVGIRRELTSLAEIIGLPASAWLRP